MNRTTIVFLFLFVTVLFISCNSRITTLHKTIALTFDDGPDSIYTEQVLDVLKSKKVKATFFLVGSSVERYGNVVERIHMEKHCIGNHSYHHLDFWNLKSNELLEKEIEPTSELICRFTGIQPRLYRPPFGFMYGDFNEYLKAKGFYIVLWDIDPRDFESDLTVQEITDKVVNGAKDKGIILMHCGNGDRSKTVKALPGIIVRLKKIHYRFIRIDEMLNVPESF
jgi:peptidoglycan-N-acetylglucosamine deacetylase